MLYLCICEAFRQNNQFYLAVTKGQREDRGRAKQNKK